MTQKLIIFIFSGLLMLVGINHAVAQLSVSNQGASISIKDGAFISVHGDILLEQDGSFDNSDTIYLWGDWINNAGNTGFTSSGEGIVILYDDTQTVKGNDTTYFHDLQATGTGVKFAEIDIFVEGLLDLTDREFNLNDNVLTVTNTDPLAVKESGNLYSGFVSAVDTGGLSRYMDTDTSYYFPVGSSDSVIRKRPVDIIPVNQQFNEFKIRMANVEPGSEGFDRDIREPDICEVNPHFYHRIYHQQGGSAADIIKYFIPAMDGDFDSIVQWRAPNPGWKKTKHGVYTFNPAPAYSSIHIEAWDDFSDFPFALADVNRELMTYVDDVICDGDTVTLATEEGFPIYEYYLNGELIHIDYQNTHTILGGLNDGDSLWVIAIDSHCIANSKPIAATVFDNPQIEAWGDTTIYPGSNVHLFVDSDAPVTWTPDDNIDCPFCPEANALEVYNSTTFYVKAEDLKGCSSIDSVIAIIDETLNIRDVIWIPNAITPNDDGINDYWNIRNLHLFPDNDVVIINRWGDEVYRASPYMNNWDGTYRGMELPEGTYYYIIRLNDINKMENGPLTILR